MLGGFTLRRADALGVPSRDVGDKARACFNPGGKEGVKGGKEGGKEGKEGVKEGKEGK